MGLERFLYPFGQRDLILSCPGKSFESPTHLFQQLRLISELGGPGVGRLGSPKAGEALGSGEPNGSCPTSIAPPRDVLPSQGNLPVASRVAESLRAYQLALNACDP